jgi:ATP-binding cassette subfamily B protein
MIPTWPISRVGEALDALARKGGLAPRAGEIPEPPQSLGHGDDFQSQWIDAVTAWLGLESERVYPTYGDVQETLRTAGPALFSLQDQSLIVLLDRRHVLAPDFSVRRVRPKELQALLTRHVEAPLLREVDDFLEDAGVARRRWPKVRAAILRERLNSTGLGPIWIVRRPPQGNVWRAASQAGLLWRIAILIGAHLIEYGLWIASWWLVGAGALAGRFDTGWLTAWALMLLTLIPLRALTTWLQGVVSLTAGGLLKERLLAGALKLEPDEVRRHGAGELLGRVVESEALEALTLSGGFLSVLAVMELGIATAVLAAGAGGMLHAALLLLWLVLTLALAWRYFRKSSAWTRMRLSMTHELIESMVGHRTRLAQEAPERWHDGEDHALERYLVSSCDVDRAAAGLSALVPRGWLIVGMLGLATAFINGATSSAGLAIGIGGTLLAWRALKGLSAGLWNLAGAAIAWDQVAPLFHAAGRERPACSPELAMRPPCSENGKLIDAEDIVFRYAARAEPVLRGCGMSIAKGDRLVLEGSSGAGKSTLGSLLAGIREPDSGLLLAGGLDHRTLGDEGWRRIVACAPQFHENHVLTGSFAFNLLMGRKYQTGENDFKEAVAICHELGLGDLLQRMPAGIMQMVGETGWQLSHGERSRLFIARALLQQAELILLDESLAALDPANLRLALECIGKHAPAALVIAHE